MRQQLPRILLIDDNTHGLTARRTVLEEQGYEVETATTGREGLSKFSEQEFDLVVTDYRMPDLRPGPQVLGRIRKQNEHMPVVILSGYVEKLGLTAESTGANAVISKGPKEEQDLIRVIARFTKKKPVSRVPLRAKRTIA